jgi:hypothetical protein
VPDAARALGSYTAAELAALTRLELAGLAMRAEDESSSLWREHQDRDGRVPAEVQERAAHLASLSDLYAHLAYRNGDGAGD